MKTLSTSRAGGSRVARGRLILACLLAVGVAIIALAIATGARPFTITQLSHRIGRPVHIDGELVFRPGLGGLVIRFARLHVDQAARAGPGAVVAIDKGFVQLPWTALLGDGRVQNVQLDGLRMVLRRDARGQTNWSDGVAGEARRPPRIAHLGIHNGSLDYQDATRSLTFGGTVTVAPNAVATPVLTVQGHGRTEDGVWSLDARSTTDLAGLTPYLLSAHLEVDKPAGRSVADFRGRLNPAEGGRLDGRLDAAGPDLHDLSHLINVPLPKTPPYRLHTHVERTVEATRLVDLSGRVGASDLAGALTISPAPGGRRLEGALRSRSLRASDLFTVVSDGQLAHGRRLGRLLPETAIRPAPLRKLTGAIRYSAASVQAPTTPTLRSLELVVSFDHGRVAADPLTLTLAHGRAVVRFVLDVRGATPHVRLDAAVNRADTSDFHPAGAAQAPLQAIFDGSVHLQGAGASVAQAAAHASGDLELHAFNGRLQETQAAVLSADLVHGVVSLLSHSRKDVAMICAVARFQVLDGEARATSLHMATDLGDVAGHGGFDLGAQTLDLTLRPETPGMVDATSVRLEGPITRPKATLAVDNPAGVVRNTLTRLLHPTPSRSSPIAGCR